MYDSSKSNTERKNLNSDISYILTNRTNEAKLPKEAKKALSDAKELMNELASLK